MIANVINGPDSYPERGKTPLHSYIAGRQRQNLFSNYGG
jgi:hypothetical protein